MRGRNKFHVIRGGRRWTKPEAYQRRSEGWLRYSSLWLGAIAVGIGAGATMAYWPSSASSATPAGIRANFKLCHTGGGDNCVVDGDTLWVQSVKIRVADIDAPETHDFKCRSEKELGDRATKRLRQLVNSGTVTLSSIDRDEDVYGRKLRIVKVDGESVGDTLVSEGLARWYGNGRRSWC